MPTKKNTYVEFELDWLQEKAEQLKTYVDNNPFDKLEDRCAWRATANGGQMPVVIATIEAQIKSLTQALKDYAQIIEVVDKLRQRESEKAEARGGKTIGGKMSQLT
jgi:hypothetical protein